MNRFERDSMLSILRWTVSNDEASARFDTVDEAALLSVLDAHRLTNQFLSKTIRTDALLKNSLVRQLQAASAHIQAKTNLFADTFEQIASSLSLHEDPSVNPLIQLKGNTAAWHLGDKSILRRSKDLDVIAQDSMVLKQSLQAIGFELDGQGICHEESTFRSESGVGIDVHRYFPVWGYIEPPKALRNGTTTSIHAIHASRIPYALIRETCVPHPATSGGGTIPGIEMAALLIAAHLFKDFIEAPQIKALAKIRLGELKEFCLLRKIDVFDNELFSDLIRASGAQDAVSFARAACHQFLACTDCGSSFTSHHGSVSQELVRGIVVSARADDEELLLRSGAASSFQATLEFNIVDAPEVDASSYTTGNTGQEGADDARSIHSLYSTPSQVRPAEIRFELHSDEESISLTITSTKRGINYRDEVAVVVPTCTYRTQFDHVDRAVRAVAEVPAWSSSWEQVGDGWRISVQIPLRDLAGCIANDGSLPIVVAYYYFVDALTDDWNDFWRSALVSIACPLSVHVRTLSKFD